MFCVSEAQAAVIRAAFEQRGELSAVGELRRLFPGVDNIALARECVRTIVDWQSLPPVRLSRRSMKPVSRSSPNYLNFRITDVMVFAAQSSRVGFSKKHVIDDIVPSIVNTDEEQQ
jgi:hypothetical protein